MCVYAFQEKLKFKNVFSKCGNCSRDCLNRLYLPRSYMVE
jgi:hypothetical protein